MQVLSDGWYWILVAPVAPGDPLAHRLSQSIIVGASLLPLLRCVAVLLRKKKLHHNAACKFNKGCWAMCEGKRQQCVKRAARFCIMAS